MKERRSRRRFIILLAAILLLAGGSALGYAFSEKGDAPERSAAWDGSVDISWYTESAADPSQVKDFYIDTPAQLAGLAYIVNGRLDMERFPLKYKANTEGTGLYKKDGEYYILSVDKDGKPNGDTDVDIEKTLREGAGGASGLIDGTEGDGTTVSGLTAADFWTETPVYLQLTGGGGGNTWDQIYTGNQKNDFMGQTVHIRADMDMGGSYDLSEDAWSGPNWTPVGGKYSMDSKTAGSFAKHDIVTIDASFNGTLDGSGHTISHLYCDRTTNKGFEYSQGVALVGQMGEVYDEEKSGYGHSDKAEEALEGWIPTVKDLAIGTADPAAEASGRGYVYGRRMVGGVVGLVGDIQDGILVENCANYATLESTDSKGIGGIVGSGWGRGIGTIRNCYNRGNVTANYAECPAGGICGANSMNIYNCYSTGQVRNNAGSPAETRASGIGRHDSATYIVDNCYSLEGSFQDTSNDGYWVGTSKTVIANVYVRANNSTDRGNGLKTDGFLEEINANAGDIFVKDTEGINDGYPILFWQAADYPAKGPCQITASGSSAGGAVTVNVPRRLSGGAYEEEQVLQPGESLQVPYGTVVTMSNEAVLPMVLDHYTAAGKELRANYYVVTEDCILGGDFIKLHSGKIHMAEGGAYHFGMVKTGAALVTMDGSDKVMQVSDYPVQDGDLVFQNDVLTYKAVLKRGAAPKDTEKEYNGNFRYEFTYPEGTLPELASTDNIVSTIKNIHKVSKAIGTETEVGTLHVSAEPETANKSWSLRADTSWYKADGSRKSYTLKRPEQLAGLAVLVNSGQDFKGIKVKLGKSISLKNNDGSKAARYWNSIGSSAAHPFRGSFDGAGYSVTGMTSVSSGGTSGLFGYVSGAAIKNLTVSGTSKSVGMTAGVAANVSGGSISGCLSNVTVVSTAAKAGGIAGELKEGAKVISCRNKGKVTATDRAGGIAGSTDASGIQIKKCANYAAVKGTGSGSSSSIGGICGYLGGAVDLSANFGTVSTAGAYAGGIAGHTWANVKAKDKASSAITNSFNWGAVKNTNGGKTNAAGGLVGYAQYILMDNCYSTGAVSLKTTGDRPHKGTLIGYFNKSIWNKIARTYYTGSGNTIICRDTNNAAYEGLDIRKQGSLDYVKIVKKSKKQMQAPAFAKLLNKQAKGSFKAVKKSFPQLVWVTGIKEYKVKFTGAYRKTVKTWYNGVVELPEAKAGYAYSFKANKKTFTGVNIKKNVTVTVTKSRVKSAYAVFLADGKEVAKVRFSSTDTYIRTAAPDPEQACHKEGYVAAWDTADMGGEPADTGNYWNEGHGKALGTSDIVVHAVYSQNLLGFTRAADENGVMRANAEITEEMAAGNGYWFLKPEARGTVTVRSGVAVTLDGSNGPFTNLRIVVEPGARLVLKDVDMTTDPAELVPAETFAGALELQGGADRSQAAAVYVSGNCSIQGINDGFNMKADGATRDEDTEYPAMLVSGYGIIDQADPGSDTIHITAYKDNPEVYISDASTMEIAGSTVEIYKYERLGAQGGMIYGTDYDYETRAARGDQHGSLAVSGGTLIAVSDTNNVFAFCVDHYSQSGGQVICYATEAETVSSSIDKGGSGLDRAVFATSMDITGGSLRAASRTHKDNEADEVFEHENGDAIRFGPDTGNLLTDQFDLCVLDTSGWGDAVHTVSIDGIQWYQGTRPAVGYIYDTGDAFTRKLSETDQHLYLWAPKTGGAHQVTVDGKAAEVNIGK